MTAITRSLLGRVAVCESLTMNSSLARPLSCVVCLLATLYASGCNAECGACAEGGVQITVTMPGGASEITVEGASGFRCFGISTEASRCHSNALPYGDHTLVFRAAGFDDGTLEITLVDQHLSGCECPTTYLDSIVLSPSGSDAGSPDGG